MADVQPAPVTIKSQMPELELARDVNVTNWVGLRFTKIAMRSAGKEH